MRASSPSEIAGRSAVIVVALLVLAGAATPASSASGEVELDAALSDQTETTEMSFTFTASTNGTVTATGEATQAGGDVEFEFVNWEDLDSGENGDGSRWTATAGHRYRVTYTASASSGASDRTYTERVTVTDSSGRIVASERLSLAVELLEPSFGRIGVVDQDFVFTSDDTKSSSVDVTIDNEGRGVMRPTDVSFSNVPSGMSVSVDSLPNTVSGRDSETMTLDVTADPSISTGSRDISVTVSDNLGNSRSFTLRVAVQKPPVLAIDEEIEPDGVIRGESKTIDVSVSEAAGFEGIDGLSYDVIDRPAGGEISVRGTAAVSTGPGGSDTIQFRIRANSDADQYETLEWRIRLRPNAQNSPARTVTVTTEVLYRARLGEVEAESQTLVFDEPRAQTNEFSTETTVSFDNDGDTRMAVVGVGAQPLDEGVSASVTDVPGTVEGTSSGSATVVLRADADLSEGTYPVEFTVTGRDAETGANERSKTVVRDLQVEQVPELDIEQTELSFGDVPPAEQRTISTDLSERLGYERVDDLTIRQTSSQGPWLEIVEQPTSLSPSQTSPLVFALRFNTSVEPFEEYTWTYEVGGKDIETREVSVTARADLVNFDGLQQNLSSYDSDWSGDIATNMNDSLTTLEKRMKSEETVRGSDLSRTVVAGRTTLLFLESVEEARTTRQQNGTGAAQPHVIRAVATYNATLAYVQRLETPAIQRPAQTSVQAAKRVVESELETQRAHYAEVLELENATTLQRAQAHRELARIERFSGNQTGAEKHRTASNIAFDRYREQVNNATEDRQRAREAFTNLHDNATIVIAGQPLVLNPARLDRTEGRIDRINSLYGSAATTLARAGATEESARARARRASVATTLQTTRTGMYAATGLYALITLLVAFRTSRNLYAYVQDARVAGLSDAVE